METISTETLLNILRSLAPEASALPKDPVGLLIEGDGRPIGRIGVCLDCTPASAQRAVQAGVDFIAVHHPLIYHPLRRIAASADPISAAAVQLVRAGIALYAMHTNWDRAHGGINDTLARLLGLRDIHPLGTEGLPSLPRVGELPEPMTYSDFCAFVEETLGCRGSNALRAAEIASGSDFARGGSAAWIRTVAVCGGAGAELSADVIAAGAHAYVTSDVRHHEFLYSSARGLALLDAGHGATETPGMKELILILQEQLPAIDIVWIGPE